MILVELLFKVISIGESFSLLSIVITAYFCSNLRTIIKHFLKQFLRVAKCNGVLPHLSCELILAPSVNKYNAISNAHE